MSGFKKALVTLTFGPFVNLNVFTFYWIIMSLYLVKIILYLILSLCDFIIFRLVFLVFFDDNTKIFELPLVFGLGAVVKTLRSIDAVVKIVSLKSNILGIIVCQTITLIHLNFHTLWHLWRALSLALMTKRAILMAITTQISRVVGRCWF